MNRLLVLLRCLTSNQALYVIVKIRNDICDNIPYDFIVDPEIAVNQSVAHSDHIRPANFVMAPPEIVRDMPRRFSDNFQTSNKSPLQDFILRKDLTLYSRREIN